jgi:hypothetical protein
MAQGTTPNTSDTFAGRCLALLGGLLFLASASAAGAATLYVDLNNPGPAVPYASWATAATNIQDAVDAAVDGDLILVTNGVYQSGATAVYGMSNRVAVTKPVTVRSVNGPAATTIEGYQMPVAINGSDAVRCVYLTNGAVLAGFTLTNGATQTSGDYGTNQSGGGVWCESASAVVTNCVVAGNSAYYEGGGAYSSTLNNCTLMGNSASDGGGTYFGTLNSCVLIGNSAGNGGGASAATLNNCTLTGNSAANAGGGTSGGTLNNCMLTRNSALTGGGASYSALNNCALTCNSASDFGGGAEFGALNNCTLTGNSASEGGGTGYGVLNNCTLTGNSAGFGGGACYGTLNNCIVYYNTARLSGDNYYDAALNYCCATPPATGTGNVSAEPQLAGNWHLSANSPCRSAGSASYTAGVDLDGEPWANPPSIGCDEYWGGSATGALSVAIAAANTNVAMGFALDFQAVIGGRVSASRWDFGDGLVWSNRLYASHAWAAPGDYLVELRAYNESYPTGMAATVTVRVVAQPVLYVSVASTNPVAPYGGWDTAATRIQDAVDIAVPGAVVLVSNGVYQAGATSVYGMSNRVAVTRSMTVQSVNGPAFTSIAGYRRPVTTNGPSAIRCAYLTNGAVLAGFTLTNGATQSSGDFDSNQSGGGVWCESLSTVVSNCTLAGNSAYEAGGGAYSGTLNNCALVANSSRLGGGAGFGTLNNCTLAGNSASYGGGAWYGTLNNCTLTGNSARSGGGAYYGTLNNCIVYYNSAPIYTATNYNASAFNYSCTTPLPPGPGNIASEPLFVNTNAWSNLRLKANSACINAGTNAFVTWAYDLDGNPRISGGRVDMGAYEFQESSAVILGNLLQVYDGTARPVSVTTIPPGLAVSLTYNGWATAPTNPGAYTVVGVIGTAGYQGAATNTLVVSTRIIEPARDAQGRFEFTFMTAPNEDYTIEVSTNLRDWVAVMGLVGWGGPVTIIDPSAPAAQRFYRVRLGR